MHDMMDERLLLPVCNIDKIDYNTYAINQKGGESTVQPSNVN